jgi:hypothetical protein
VTTGPGTEEGLKVIPVSGRGTKKPRSQRGPTIKDVFMIDTALANRVKKLSDAELEREESAAYNSAYYESFGNDFEARADAIQEYEMLARELKSRKVAAKKHQIMPD